MIPLVKNTISFEEIKCLQKWLDGNPRLTKGENTVSYEEEWSKKIGCKHSVFVNSGSSAILLSLYCLMEQGRLKRGDKVIVPAVSWSTDLSPVIQLGLNPILCDCNLNNLSIEIDSFKVIAEKLNPKALILVSVLGLVPEMDEIVNICSQNDIILIEDSCESLGSSYKNKNLGSFGAMSCFSTYFGHHISTIEGGMICTNERKTYNLLKSLRSHGWDRDMDEDFKDEIKKKYEVKDDFESLYKFYYCGFNFRSTDLQAFLGLGQIAKLENIITSRNDNYNLYNSLIKNNFWKSPESSKDKYVSNFAYPVIHPERKSIIKDLMKNEVQTRPLICGSLGRQPFWTRAFGERAFKNADLINDYGFYLPNNHEMNKDEIHFISNIINRHTK